MPSPKPYLAALALSLALSGLFLARAQTPSESAATRPSAAPADTDAVVVEQGSSERLKPRPSLTDAEYTKFAADLRETYSKPASEWPKPDLSPDVLLRELGRLPAVVHPTDNPYSKAKAELGRTLFFDGRLSGSGQMACISCHDNDLGWADGRTLPLGNKVQILKRNTPSILNSAYATSLFWDGRAASLEQQALMPIGNADEMHSTAEDAAKRIAEVPGYKPLFKEAFGTEEITSENLSKAIACFERTIVAGRSRFDTFLNGKPDVLSDSAVRGLHLFRTQARCINCHSGPEMTDGKFHNEGLSYYGRPLEDLGRYNLTKKPEDVGAFKTPTLRNITRTAPYMHTGLFDLDQALHFYNGGGLVIRRSKTQQDDPLFPAKTMLLQPMHRNKQDFLDLRAFLESLEEPHSRIRPPVLP